MTLFDERYRAIASRDRRFDGQFYTAVRTTGIYCRPSCPARTPRPENVTFYETSAAAHEAGYRACKRCLPEAVPGTPAWDVRSDLAARAMRLVRDGVVDREGVDGLAARLGYSPRHLHRVLVAELGAGPVALARAVRAQTARSLIVGTGLPLAEVAFAAGFGSIRQFNDTVAEVFDATPSALRRRARGHVAPPLAAPADPFPASQSPAAWADPFPARPQDDPSGPGGQQGSGPTQPGAARPRPEPATGDGVGRGPRAACPASALGEPSSDSRPACRPPGGSPPGLIELTLPYREPFDAAGVFAFLATRAVPGVERVGPVPPPASLVQARVVEDDRPGRRPPASGPGPAPLVYARTVALPHGPGAFEASFADGRFTVRLELTSTADLGTAIARVRHLFDLDADPVAVDSTLAADPLLGPLVAAAPGVRAPGSVDPHEIVIRTLVGQQISVSAARTHLARLAALGTPYVSRLGVDRLFPTARQIADGGRELLRGPARRTETVLSVARALADDAIDVSPSADRDALSDALLAQPGVGPWSVGYVTMRVLHDPDVLLVSDGALLTGARRLGLVDQTSSVEAQRRRLAAWGEAWAPWRTYASVRLWQAAGSAARPVGDGLAQGVSAPNRPPTPGGNRPRRSTPDEAGRTRGETPRRPRALPARAASRPGRPRRPPQDPGEHRAPRPIGEDALMTVCTAIVATPDGPFTVVVSDGVVLASGWTTDVPALVALIHASLRPRDVEPVEADDARVSAATGAVAAYYAGDLAAIAAVPVRQVSGPFRTHAWDTLRTVEPGRPVTYAEYAALSGRPRAVRAAGSACALNAAALFVPCHRVLRTDGSLGGFRYGLAVKRSLLDREAASVGSALA